MINPLQGNAGPVRSGQSVSSEAAKAASKKTNAVAQDTAEVSSFSKQHDELMQALRALPDVRSDVVSDVKDEAMGPGNYPPLDIISGIGKLIGKAIKP
jgi:hypothetical protein